MPIGPWIVDFASLSPKLVIEVDDPSHDWCDESARSAYLRLLGFAILRFENRDVAVDVDSAIEWVREWVRSLNATGRPPG